MFSDKISRFKVVPATLISFGSLGQAQPINDVYNLPVEASATSILSANSATPTMLPSFISNELKTYTTTTGHFIAPAPQVKNEVCVALNKCGINDAIGNELLNMAKGILAEMSYTDIRVEPVLVTDPEENATYLTLRLCVHATFEESLELDSKLTRELVQRTDNLPENLSFAVYDIG